MLKGSLDVSGHPIPVNPTSRFVAEKDVEEILIIGSSM